MQDTVNKVDEGISNVDINPKRKRHSTRKLNWGKIIETMEMKLGGRRE